MSPPTPPAAFLCVTDVPAEGSKNQAPTSKLMHRPKAIPQNMNCNNASNGSSPNTPRFAGSLPSFASIKGDVELPDVTSEQAAGTAAIKLVLTLKELCCHLLN